MKLNAPDASPADGHAFTPHQVAAADGPLLVVELGPDGKPCGARGAVTVDAPPARVWAVVTDLARYAARVPMIHKVKLHGERASVHLRFRVALFSAGFDFTADVVRDEGRAFELRWVSGEPAAIRLRFDVVPHPDGAGTVLYDAVRFDIQSLGWLVKYFLKHHPEIQFGVFTGSAMALLDSVRRAAPLPDPPL